MAAPLCLCVLIASSHGQTSQPTAVMQAASVEAVAPIVTPAARGPLESRPINRNSTGPTTQAVKTSVPGAGLDIQKVILSLGIVIGLIMLLRWAAKWMFPGQAGIPASRAVQVVSRSVLSPRQQFLLLQVGRRLVVVADSPAGMNSVCEISDADEVAELLGQVRSQPSGALGKGFLTMFGRKREQFEMAESSDIGERSALLDEGPSDDADDPAVGMTREEIGGLMDKVRMLSRQFKRP
jgi:flagellar biogenesis protein FliO